MLSIKSIDRQTWVKFFTHLIVIVMIFFLPEMMMNYSRFHRHPVMERIMYYKAAAFVLVFYLNYYVILRYTLFGKKRSYVAFVGWNLLLIVAFITFFYYLGQQIWPMPFKRDPHYHEMPRMIMLMRQSSYILRDTGMIVLTIALSAALRFAERWASLQKRHEQLLASQKNEELQNLKSQLNPHFLFNTLNTIYSLVDIDPRQAQDAIHQLSRLMRYVLYENPSKVPLAQEIDFIRSYLSLMEMRIGEGIVNADFTGVADSNLEVAPLIFISIIENALKHGNTGVKGQPIEVSITTDADGAVFCRTFNHFRKKEGGEPELRSGGIGLSNLRRRLMLIYGKNAQLNTNIEDDTYTAILTIKTIDNGTTTMLRH